MDILLYQPLGYSELGGRNNNEDFIHPDPKHVSTSQKWFIVCDGVGGSEKGEVASFLAATVLDRFFKQQPGVVLTEELTQEAVVEVEHQFNAYLKENEQAKGMATTMTLLFFHEAGATVAHIGDSRIYHLRQGEIIWRSQDHSYVNELLQAGVLTAEEARVHPQKNIITRALQGGEKGVKASVQIINNVVEDDYFFLCTDGVLERVSDELLEGTLRDNSISNELKIERLCNYSSKNTRDNFSAYLIQIKKVSGTVDPTYRFAAPVYKRINEDSDIDGSVTLLNMPVPDNVSNLQPHLEFKEVPSEKNSKISDRTERLQDDREIFKKHSQRDKQTGNYKVLSVFFICLFFLSAAYLLWRYNTDSQKINQNEPQNESSQNRPVVRVDTFTTTNLSNSEKVGIKNSENPINTNHNKESESLISQDVKTPKTLTRVKEVEKGVWSVIDLKTNLLGLQESNGKQVVEPRYRTISTFSRGIATVYTVSDQKRFLSLKGKEFDEVDAPNNGRIAVRIGQKWGYLNYNGDMPIKVKFDRAGSFGLDSTAEVSLNGQSLRIDKKGNPVVKSDTKS